MQPGATIALFVDPQNPVDMAIDWIRTGQLGPQPPGSTPGPGEPAGTLFAHKCTGAGSLPTPSTRWSGVPRLEHVSVSPPGSVTLTGCQLHLPDPRSTAGSRP